MTEKETTPKKKKKWQCRGVQDNSYRINYVLDSWERIEEFCERVRRRKNTVSRRGDNMRRNNAQVDQLGSEQD